MSAAPSRWRLWVHALDRTGPPRLALALAEWLVTDAGVEVEVLAFRGGPLVHEAGALGPVHVVLDDEEPWQHGAPDPRRAADLAERLASLAVVDVNLLVSVAAGQALPLVGAVGPIATWVVEAGEGLHWLDAGLGLRERTDAWLAGSRTSVDALAALAPDVGPVALGPEFVPPPAPVPVERIDAVRRAVGADVDDVLVAGVGIGTRRKGIDLFLEVAALVADEPRAALAWVGGERDPLHRPVRDAAARLGLRRLAVLPSTDDVDAVFAAADLVVHPAREDSFPLTCLHAASRATPVLAFSGAGGVPEMLGPSFAGVPYPDTARLALRVRELVRDPAARTAVGTAQETWVAPRHLAPSAAAEVHARIVAALGIEARR